MRMMYILTTCLLSAIYLPSITFAQYPKNYFDSPVTFPLNLTANFGELRSNAFHAGIDIRTGGTTGHKVLSAAEGFVYRIVVSPSGYGKALYIEHPNGYATVYAHLDEFSSEIEEYVKEQQYRFRRFNVDLHPPRNLFRFNQGDIIGKSGNTGSSSGPHLHFEIRNAVNQVPVNPLLFGFDIPDNLPPVLHTLAIYPLDNESRINGQNKPVFLPLEGQRGTYRFRSNSMPKLSGNIGFGIEATDFLNNSPNRCGAWSIQLLHNEKIVYRHELTQVPFHEGRFLNAHIDYAERISNRRDIQRTFILPNNRLSIYTEAINRGIIRFDNEDVHDIKLFVDDAYRNRSELSFKIQSTVNSDLTLTPQTYSENFVMLMRYDRSNRYSTDDISINIPSGALYDDLLFEFSSTAGDNRTISAIYHIHNQYTPVHQNYNITIQLPDLDQDFAEKALIVNLNNSKPAPVSSSRWENGTLQGETNLFGYFTVMIDTIPPLIRPRNLTMGKDLSKETMLSFTITDNLSGILNYNGYIDDKWVLFEYDPKNDHLFYRFDSARIGSGKNRNLRLEVSDARGNITYFNSNFYY